MTLDPSADKKIDDLFNGSPSLAAFERELVTSAYMDSLRPRSDEEYLLSPKEFKQQREHFLQQLDNYLKEISPLDINKGAFLLGRFAADMRFYPSHNDEIERHGLIELRRQDGKNFVLIDDRLRTIAGGAAASQLAFIGSEGTPDAVHFLSPRAFSAETDKLAIVLKSKVGALLLEQHSALYCLMRQALGSGGHDVGWRAGVTAFKISRHGEIPEYTFRFEGGRMFAVSPAYAPETCRVHFNIEEIT